MNTSRPLRILFLIDSFQMGGAERITAALLPLFDSSAIVPVVCTLHTRGESPLVKQLGDIARFDLAARRLLDPRAFRALLRLLRDQHIDVIHAQLQDATVMGALAHHLTGIPLVITRHVLGDDVSNWRRSLRSALERWAVRTSVSKVISVSDATTAFFQPRVGLPVSRFQTIYNGIDLERFRTVTDKDALRVQLELPRGKPLVTMIGVLRVGKGQDVCIEAARLLPDVNFLLVGDGEERANLERQAAELSSRVYFLGQRMDVPEILSASDLFVLPSDSEALPTVLIEAAASSLPVIATTVGGIPEIVEDGVTGILIPPRRPDLLAQQIQGLFNQPETAQRMGEEANRRARTRFSLPAQVAELTRLYETIAAQRG